MFLVVVVVFVFELIVVALAVAVWMINQRLDDYDFSPVKDAIQSTENQKKPQVLESRGGSLSNGKEEFLIPSCVVQDDQLPRLNESLEPDRARRKTKHNLRKSLEWDSAFLTSAGVLDPEELSCLINGAEQGEKQMLTGIQDDVWRSIDSISTLESVTFFLKEPEAEMFEDIRASIQKFSKQALTAARETCQATSDESQSIYSKRKTNISSQNQEQQPAFRKPIGISKSLTYQTVGRQGTVRAVRQDAFYSQTEQPVDRHGDSNLTQPKPPRIINKGKSNPKITAKRALIAASQANKIKHDKTTVCTVAGKRPHASKKPMVSRAHKVLTKPASSSKASSFDSSNSTNFPASSLTDISGSVCSEKVCKSHLAPIQKNVGDRNVKTPSSDSTFKTPPKTATRDNTTSGNAAVTAYLVSSENSSSISPDSSLSEWSSSPSPSSSSSSWSTSLDTSPSRSLGYDIVTLAFNDHDNRQILDEHDFSLENDDLVLESFGGSLSNEKEAGLIASGNQDDQFSYLNKSLEPRRATRRGQYSLRRSLDWDSAFFTSYGVLDPEELSCLINGAEQSEKQILTGTQDHFYDFLSGSGVRPGDSNLTLPNPPQINNEGKHILAKPASSFNSSCATKSATSSLTDSSGGVPLSSEWSPASSSPCTINLRCNKSGSSFDTSSGRSSGYNMITSDLNDHYSSQMLDKHENGGMATSIGSVMNSSTQASTLSCSAAASPSALRMPSPKFGFFDWFTSFCLRSLYFSYFFYFSFY